MRVVVIVEDLNAEVRQIVPCDINAALVEIEQADVTVVVNPNVTRTGIPMDHGPGMIFELGEYRQHVSGGVVGHLTKVGVDA